jgi:N-acetylneuraminate lyase
MNSNTRFQLIAATYTPFDRAGAVNTRVIANYASLLRTEGVDAVFICGTTGEGPSLSAAERKHLAEAWVTSGQLPVIVNVAHCSLTDAVELASDARRIGATAVATTAPFYFRPTTIDALVPWLTAVAAAAAPLPFYYYDIPSLTGVNIPASQIMERLIEVAPNFAGVKYSNPDLLGLQECVRHTDLDVYFGIDESLLAAISLGVRGAVGSTYNYLAMPFREMIEAVEHQDWLAARALQNRLAMSIRRIIHAGGIAAGKALMAARGVPCGPPRLPLIEVSPESVVNLVAAITADMASHHTIFSADKLADNAMVH